MDLSIWILIGVAVLLVKSFLPAYFNKKGENLATKEDIQDITTKVEDVKASIGSKLYVHQFRYQNEFMILKDLSEKLVGLRDSALLLRPTLDTINPNESEEERKQKRLAKYDEASKAFYKLYEANKPFYPDEIYRGLNRLHDIVWKEVVQYGHASEKDRRDPKYWNDATENAKGISKLADEIIELIRKRVKYWEEFK